MVISFTFLSVLTVKGTRRSLLLQVTSVGECRKVAGRLLALIDLILYCRSSLAFLWAKFLPSLPKPKRRRRRRRKGRPPSSIMPTETRAAAKRRRLAEMTPLPDLPAVAHILGYLDVASLVRTAACSQALRQQVYEGSPELWKKLDFGFLDSAGRLTDVQLDRLLQNCRARERCEILNLNGSVRLTGTGLEPLRGSRVLRELDLRLDLSAFVGPVEWNATVVLPILSSMPPITAEPELRGSEYSLGLALVKIRPQNDNTNYFSRFRDDVADWDLYREFAEALRAQATERRTRCGYCHRVIADMWTEEDMWWVVPTGYCECCKRYSCNDGDCCNTKTVIAA